jgi:hypothetical protein
MNFWVERPQPGCDPVVPARASSISIQVYETDG